MRSKKAQILEISIVFVFIILLIFLYGNTAQHKEVVATIGAKQYAVLDSYVEAEKAKEYVKLSARLSALQVEEIGSGEKCFTYLSTTSFAVKFEDKMANYLSKYTSSREDLTVTLPDYTYWYELTADKLTIRGYPDGNIKVTGGNFEYEADPYFKQTITCDKRELLFLG